MPRKIGHCIVITAAVMGAISCAFGDESSIRRGEALLSKNCARCHAVGASGASPHPEAPAFRILSGKYPIEGLAEALAEGLFVGHPDMPEFVFESADIRAILDYLQSIQQK